MAWAEPQKQADMPTGSRTSQYKKLGKRKERAVFDRVLLLLFFEVLKGIAGQRFLCLIES